MMKSCLVTLLLDVEELQPGDAEGWRGFEKLLPQFLHSPLQLQAYLDLG